MLSLRILTATILIPLVLLAIFVLPQHYFAAVATLVIMLAAWEWARLAGWTKIWMRLLYVFFALTILFMTVLLPPLIVLMVGAVCWIFIFFYLLFIRTKTELPQMPMWIVTFSGLIILACCWEALLVLHKSPIWLLFMLIIVWLADTGAYFGGRLWGKHLLTPLISPKKTWEGLIVGIILTLIIATIVQWFFIMPHKFSWQLSLIILITVFASVVGDLWESLLKRLQNIKDSGSLLPGHGGILDRIDSVLAAAPVFAAGLVIAGLPS